MGAAADLVALKVEKLDPLYGRYWAGQPFPPFDYIFSVMGADDAGKLFVKLGGEWFASAQEVLGKSAPGLEVDTLAVAMDDLARKRSELVGRGVGLDSPTAAAFRGFIEEFEARLDAIVRSVTPYIPSPPTAFILVALVLVAAIVVLGRR